MRSSNKRYFLCETNPRFVEWITWGDDQIRWRGSVGSTFEITPYLDTANVDPETKRVLDVALEMTRKCLGLEDDFANGMIASQIIEIAKTGERDPDLLCEGALKKLRQGLFGD